MAKLALSKGLNSWPREYEFHNLGRGLQVHVYEYHNHVFSRSFSNIYGSREEDFLRFYTCSLYSHICSTLGSEPLTQRAMIFINLTSFWHIWPCLWGPKNGNAEGHKFHSLDFSYPRNRQTKNGNNWPF